MVTINRVKLTYRSFTALEVTFFSHWLRLSFSGIRISVCSLRICICQACYPCVCSLSLSLSHSLSLFLFAPPALSHTCKHSLTFSLFISPLACACNIIDAAWCAFKLGWGSLINNLLHFIKDKKLTNISMYVVFLFSRTVNVLKAITPVCLYRL